MSVPISNVTRRVVFTASGTGPYSFTFEILANTDISVYKDDTLLTLTTDYTVTINSNGTGSITLVTSPTGATQIAIVGNRTIQRTTDFVTGGDFFANTVNDEMDQQTIFAQQNAEGLQRALQAPQTDPTNIDMTLPRKADRAGKVLSFSSTGNPVASDSIGNNRGNWAAATAYLERDLVKDTSNSNIYQCKTAHTSTGSQPISTNTDSAKWYLIVDAATADASADAAAVSASDSADSASEAAASATLANDWATKTSGAVSGGEYSAKYHANAASSSASAASSSASSASSAQSAAESARDATLAAFDSFDDRYLGAKTSDPTVDNDGNALTAGALYFNSSTGAMMLYTGSAWVAAYVSGSGYLASSNNLSDVASAATARTNLGLVIGTNVQAYDADLTSWAGISPSTKQETLVSGTNIKTVNGTSLLGSGDVSIIGNGGATASGSVTLTSSSGGAQAITTTDYGQYVKLPDATTMTEAACVFSISNSGYYPLKVINNSNDILGFIYPNQSSTVDLVDNSISAGTWEVSNVQPMAATAVYSPPLTTTIGWGNLQIVELDSSRTMVLGFSTSIFAIVYDSSTNTWGTAVTVRATVDSQTWSQLLIDTDKVLVVSTNTTALEAVIVSVSGTTLTVNTAATATLAAIATNNECKVIAVGSTYVYGITLSATTGKFYGMTVSGTTVTIGTPVNVSGIPTYISLYSSSSTTFFSLASGTSMYVEGWTVSGTTITNTTSRNASSCVNNTQRLVALGGGAYVIIYPDASSIGCRAFTVSGATVSTLGAFVGFTGGPGASALTVAPLVLSSSKILVVYPNSSNASVRVNHIAISGTTITLGTYITLGINSLSTYNTMLGFSGNYAYMLGAGAASTTVPIKFVFDISGTSPVEYKRIGLTFPLNGIADNIVAYALNQTNEFAASYGSRNNGYVGNTVRYTINTSAAYSIKFNVSTFDATIVPIVTDTAQTSFSANSSNVASNGAMWTAPSAYNGIVRIEGASV